MRSDAVPRDIAAEARLVVAIERFHEATRDLPGIVNFVWDSLPFERPRILEQLAEQAADMLLRQNPTIDTRQRARQIILKATEGTEAGWQTAVAIMEAIGIFNPATKTPEMPDD